MESLGIPWNRCCQIASDASDASDCLTKIDFEPVLLQQDTDAIIFVVDSNDQVGVVRIQTLEESDHLAIVEPHPFPMLSLQGELGPGQDGAVQCCSARGFFQCNSGTESSCVASQPSQPGFEACMPSGPRQQTGENLAINAPFCNLCITFNVSCLVYSQLPAESFLKDIQGSRNAGEAPWCFLAIFLHFACRHFWHLLFLQIAQDLSLHKILTHEWQAAVFGVLKRSRTTTVSYEVIVQKPERYPN